MGYNNKVNNNGYMYGSGENVFFVSYTFAYDANGNMTKDGSRSISSIAYNNMNLPQTITFNDGNQIIDQYRYDGVKTNATYRTKRITTTIKVDSKGDTIRSEKVSYDTRTRQYFGDLIKENGRSSRIYNEAGYIDLTPNQPPRYRFHVKDYLGSNRSVVDENGYLLQSAGYYPSGLAYGESGELTEDDRLHNGKELISFNGLYMYNNEARQRDLIFNRFTSIDPLAEKYPSWSPYAVCANNPLRFMDPTGMDIWEVDKNGRITNHIKDTTQDTFVRVDEDGNRMEGENCSVTFKYRTVKETDKKVSYKKSFGESKQNSIKVFEIAGDENATKAFNLLTGGDGDKKIEWGQVKIGTEDSGMNLVGTSNSESSSPMSGYALNLGVNIRESNHNHPSGDTTPSEGDIENARKITAKYPDATFNILGKPNTPVPFNKNSPYIMPSYPGSKTGILMPGKKW